METIRSPFFYVGDKYKLMPQIQKRMSKDVEDYIEPFVGGGSSFLNAQGRRYILNDINPYVIGLHRELLRYIGKKRTAAGKAVSNHGQLRPVLLLSGHYSPR